MFVKHMLDGQRALGALMLLIMLPVFGYFVFKPQERLPVSWADGTYSNACCGSLTLMHGRGFHGSETFEYVIEDDKAGPYVLPVSTTVMADESGLSISKAKHPFELRLDGSGAPEWIDILGPHRTYRFIRQP